MNYDKLEGVLLETTKTGASFAELFIEETTSNNVVFINSKIDRVSTNILHGAGIRACTNDKTYYAYSNIVDEKNLMKMASDLSSLVFGERVVNSIELKQEQVEANHPVLIYPKDVKIDKKKEIMKIIDDTVRAYSDKVSQVEMTLMDSVQHIKIANSDGKYIEDERVRIRLFINVTATDGITIENEINGSIAGLKGYELFDEYDFESIGRELAAKVVNKLCAEDCPSGEMPVVIGNGFGGVIFHEACVHSLEAIRIANDMSPFSDKIGQKVASDIVTLYDDGTIQNRWGSSNIDDEGNITNNNILIENGILKNYLTDSFNGKKINHTQTGSSRRESYKFIPISRMNNTYLKNGINTLEEIIKSIEYGLYAKNMRGGSVNPKTGDFNFGVSEAYMIRNGEIKEQVKGASLIGNGPEVLMNIEMIANDFDYGVGMCGAESGSVPVTIGQPSIKVSKMTVGGRKKDA